jgi:DNA-binding LytR/AlgR family response regulator
MSRGLPGLRALVVDDEEPAVEELRFRLVELGEPGDRVDTATSAREALRLLRERSYDVIFLDIQMPGLSGLEVAQVVGDEGPAIVFVTAYEEHAVVAFELGAADYLVKPVQAGRLGRTLARLRSPSDQPAQAAPPLERLPVESAGRTILLDTGEIRFAEAQGDVVYVRARDRAYPTRYSLGELERRLPQPPFLRVHRAFIVNLRNVVEIRPYFNGTYLLKTNDEPGTELTVSRGRVGSLRALLGL